MTAVPEPRVELPVTPSFRLDGRRALVTGAGRGLGVAIAAALAEAGAQVHLVARTAADVEAVVAAIKLRGGRAVSAVFDVTDIEHVRSELSGSTAFDILVNNAGTNRPKPMVEVTEADFAAIFDLNVRAAYFVSQTVIGRMIADGRGGSIINISSQMGHVGAPNRTLYCASKHALEGLTKAMAVELAASNIRVNTIAPTFIETPLTRPYFQDPAFSRDVLSRIKLGRLGRVEDVMGAVLYLASDASALVTGTSLVVDGGWTSD